MLKDKDNVTLRQRFVNFVKKLWGRFNMSSPAVAIIISIISLLLSMKSYSYEKAEYEYKRQPVFSDVGGEVYIAADILNDGNIRRYLIIDTITLKIEERNNLNEVYLISSDYDILRFNDDEIEDEIKIRLTETFENNGLIESEGYLYLYCFLLYTGLDGSVNLDLFYYKTEDFVQDEVSLVTFNRVGSVELLGFTKDVEEGERCSLEKKMIEQYNEIFNFYNQFHS